MLPGSKRESLEEPVFLFIVVGLYEPQARNTGQTVTDGHCLVLAVEVDVVHDVVDGFLTHVEVQ